MWAKIGFGQFWAKSAQNLFWAGRFKPAQNYGFKPPPHKTCEPCITVKPKRKGEIYQRLLTMIQTPVRDHWRRMQMPPTEGLTDKTHWNFD